jgi:hypothetical protein
LGDSFPYVSSKDIRREKASQTDDLAIPSIKSITMNVSIRSATTADSAAIAEIYFQAYQHLGWFQHVNGEVDPNELKAFIQSVALAIQKQNGVAFVAEKDGKVVGHLLGWERAADAAVETSTANPYYDTNVTVNLRGRVCSRWVNQQADIRQFSGQMGSGRFFCESR